jgi:hypothetical protein
MKKVKILSREEVEFFESTISDQLADIASELAVEDEKLSITGTILNFSSVIEGNSCSIDYDLADFWVPGSGGFEHPVPLILYQHHIKTAINALDVFAQGVGHTPSFTKGGATRFIKNLIKFIEWSLLHGHVQLKTISPSDIDSFCNDIKKGGISEVLKLTERLNILWENIKDDIGLVKEILTEPTKKYGYRSINVTVIEKMIGSTSLQGMIPNSFYQLVGRKLRSYCVKVIDDFETKGVMAGQKPSAKTLNTLFGQWNSLARMDGEDEIPFLPFKDPYRLSNQLGKPRGRTKNLGTEQVIKLLRESNLWLHKISPLIIKVVKEISSLRAKQLDGKTQKETKHYIVNSLYPEKMASSKELNTMEEILEIKISRKHPSNIEEDGDKWTFTDCITALMSACFVVLQIYNARRQAEISDPIIGVSKEEHFRCKDQESSWYQANFYHEKDGGRNWHTINKSSTKALQVLFDLKNSWGGHNHAGLFIIPRFNINANNEMSAFKYSFNKGKDSRYTGNNFLDRALDSDVDLVKGSHIFRRIYAIIYHYQYEHTDLLALCYQLGHIDPEVTEIYVTDLAARETHESLQNKVKLNQSEESSSVLLIKTENKALDKIIKEVDTEKTASDILELMMGTNIMAGRYPTFLKRIFKILQKSVKFNQKIQKNYQTTFDELSIENQSIEVAKIVSDRGHINRPKPHSNCHRSPDKAKAHDGPCDPIECRGCAYQDVKQSHLDIMKEDLQNLKEIANNGQDYMIIERMQATEQAKNLDHVITQHERTMLRNGSLFQGF